MKSAEERDFNFVERIARAEEKLHNHANRIQAASLKVEVHEKLITTIEGKVTTLVVEVRQVRNALYSIAAALMISGLPALQVIGEKILHSLGH